MTGEFLEDPTPHCPAVCLYLYKGKAVLPRASMSHCPVCPVCYVALGASAAKVWGLCEMSLGTGPPLVLWPLNTSHAIKLITLQVDPRFYTMPAQHFYEVSYVKGKFMSIFNYVYYDAVLHDRTMEIFQNSQSLLALGVEQM